MILKGMKITNQLLYQLSYKGMQRCINKNQYFAIIIMQLMLAASVEAARNIAKCSLVVTLKSYSNRTQDPIEFGISNFIPFLRKQKKNKRNENDTKKSTYKI
jgi:hypothetical protein